MNYKLYPPVKQIAYQSAWCDLELLHGARCNVALEQQLLDRLPNTMKPDCVPQEGAYTFSVGEPPHCAKANRAQGYLLRVAERGISISATDLAGLRYGLDTLLQLVEQAQDGRLSCLEIEDYPSVLQRGLMLDVSRGKVYTREYLLGLVDMLGRLRYNVLQLYIEHTFEFKKHPEICQGSDPLTADDILAVQARCKENGIELQANLQSLGHCNRILTRAEHQNLAESDLYWSLSTTSADALQLLEELYGEYLPLFESKWLNVCLDEPYDIGSGQSAHFGKRGEELYLSYLLKIHDLAAKFGKQIMMFGDVFCRHPELIGQMPDDIIYMDWCYDPKPIYGTPATFAQHGMPFWVCPGSGNWNTLFPRLDGAITNIATLTLEGIQAGAGGTLFTDWNDHGAYAQPGPGYYLYAYAAAVSWGGLDPGRDYVGGFADKTLSMPGYAAAVLQLAEIYQLPPIWSKNRSECVMALFDEPIFGNAVRGPEPPSGLKAYDLSLPEGIAPVLERHSQHPLRPYFAIPECVCVEIGQILDSAQPLVSNLKSGDVKNQLRYIIDAFSVMLDKLALSRKVLSAFDSGTVDIPVLIGLEDELRVMIRRYVHLQIAYIGIWTAIAKVSELEISITYFAHIIERLDYLRNWLSLNRERIGRGETPDLSFETYETAGYGTLPTY